MKGKTMSMRTYPFPAVTLVFVCCALAMTVAGPAPAADAERGLHCETAVPIQPDIVIDGDNTGASNGADYYSCPYWPMSGGEDIYEMTVHERAGYHIRLTSSGCDLGMFLFPECNADAECLAHSEDIEDGVSAFYINLDPGIYYIVVDGFLFAGCPYELLVEVTSDLHPTDRCDEMPLACLPPASTPTTITGGINSNSGYNPDYVIHPGPCIEVGFPPYWSAPTNDVVYVLAMNEGDQFAASVQEGAWLMYLTDDCESHDCLAGSGYNYYAPYSFSYTHTGEYALLYFVIAGFEGSAEGVYTIDYTHTGDCGHPIPNEAATWGEVKSMYR